MSSRVVQQPARPRYTGHQSSVPLGLTTFFPWICTSGTAGSGKIALSSASPLLFPLFPSFPPLFPSFPSDTATHPVQRHPNPQDTYGLLQQTLITFCAERRDNVIRMNAPSFGNVRRIHVRRTSFLLSSALLKSFGSCPVTAEEKMSHPPRSLLVKQAVVMLLTRCVLAQPATKPADVAHYDWHVSVRSHRMVVLPGLRWSRILL